MEQRVYPILKLAKALEGVSQPQVRRWRVNALGAIDLKGISTNKYVRGLSLVAAVRWEDKGFLGFQTFDDDPRVYDPSRPIWSRANIYVDGGVAYLTSIGRRIRATVQLNVKNAFEDGGLRPIAALPNGVPHSYSIVDPRQFILSTRFDF